MKRWFCMLLAGCLLASFAAPTLAGDSSWLFLPGKYSHHPVTGERLNQYMPLPTLAALPDTRPYASGYRRSRVSERGVGGTTSDYYRVDNWSGGGSGIDAEWERFNDVWQRSSLVGGYGAFSGYGGVGYGVPGYGGGYGLGYAYPGYGGGHSGGYGPGYGGGYGPHPGQGHHHPQGNWHGNHP